MMSLLFSVFAISSFITSLRAEPLQQPLLLIVGIDSFRWNFLDRGRTPNFDSVIGSGIRAEHLVNVFPTKSAPNWYSIVTGLYPESHGIVNNHIYDPQLNSTAPMETLDWLTPDELWNQAEPIWITNQRQGGSSAVLRFLWGMNVNYDGFNADYKTEAGKVKIDPEVIVDEVIELLVNGSVNLGIIWFPDVDHACHKFGPESKEVTGVIEEMDRAVGYLLDKLGNSGLNRRLNLMFVSDHGHVDMEPSNVVFLSDHVNSSLYLGYQDNPSYSIFPHKDQDTQVIYDKLKDVEHIDVWKKDEIPEEWHYRNNARIPPILVMTELRWNVAQNKSEKAYWEDNIGEHGYPNNISDMWPFFLAKGPAFRRGIRSDPFSTLDVYSLACHILRIEPRPHNGSLENVKHLLIYEDQATVESSGLLGAFLFVCVFIIILLTGVLLATCSKFIKYKNQAIRTVEAEGLLSDEDL